MPEFIDDLKVIMDGTSLTTILQSRIKVIESRSDSWRKSLVESIKSLQATAYNLGNGCIEQDPLNAAKLLFSREYGDTHLFQQNGKTTHQQKAGVFIPPVFVSEEFELKNAETADLSYAAFEDIERSIENTTETVGSEWYVTFLKSWLRLDNRRDFATFREFQTKLVILCACKEVRTLEKLKSSLTELWAEASRFLPGVSGNETSTDIRKYAKQWLTKNPPSSNLLQRFLSNVSRTCGEMVEHYLYNKLKVLENNILQETVLLHTVNIKIKNYKCEHDFVIFCPKHNLIIGIEVKRTLNSVTSAKAVKQLDRLYDLLKNRFEDDLRGWHFFPAIFTFNNELQLSSNQIITKATDFREWLTKVIQENGRRDISTDETYMDLRNVLEKLLFIMNISKPYGLVRSSNWTSYISQAIKHVSTWKSIMFYSGRQLELFETSDQYKVLVLFGAYGTGKSFIMQGKAEQLALQILNQKSGEGEEPCEYVWYVLWQKKTLLLKLMLQNKWQHLKGIIKVVSLFLERVPNHLRSYLQSGLLTLPVDTKAYHKP